MLKADELRVMDEEELVAKFRELKEALFNLRFQHATGQLDNPMRIKETRKDIARVCTVMTERELGIHEEAFVEARTTPPRRRPARVEEDAAEEPEPEEGEEEVPEGPVEAEEEEEAEEEPLGPGEDEEAPGEEGPPEEKDR